MGLLLHSGGASCLWPGSWHPLSHPRRKKRRCNSGELDNSGYTRGQPNWKTRADKRSAWGFSCWTRRHRSRSRQPLCLGNTSPRDRAGNKTIGEPCRERRRKEGERKRTPQTQKGTQVCRLSGGPLASLVVLPEPVLSMDSPCVSDELLCCLLCPFLLIARPDRDSPAHVVRFCFHILQPFCLQALRSEVPVSSHFSLLLAPLDSDLWPHLLPPTLWGAPLSSRARPAASPDLQPAQIRLCRLLAGAPPSGCPESLLCHHICLQMQGTLKGERS